MYHVCVFNYLLKYHLCVYQVAQDAAYYELKEKYDQLEGNHERLQQNMVQVQMEKEAISGQYQDELRLRPETLNKYVNNLPNAYMHAVYMHCIYIMLCISYV